MKRHWHSLSAMVLALLLVSPGVAIAAQSTPAATYSLMPASPSELGAPSVPEPAVSNADEAEPYALAVAPYAEFGTDAAPGEFPRTVIHAMGTTVVESAPIRVIALDNGELDALILLGIVPIGTVDGYDLPGHLKAYEGQMEDVGTLAEPDLEKIAALKPDLIISSKLRHEELYPLLNEIAPTIFAERPGVAFKHSFALIAQAIGREAEGAAVIQQYEDKVRALNAALPADRPVTGLAQIRADHIRFYQLANFVGVVLNDIGMPRNAIGNIDDFAALVSPERLVELSDAELIIVSVQGGEENEWGIEIMNGPLWASLPAVQTGDVFEVDSTIWISGVGYGSAFVVLDQIAEYFDIEL